MATDFFERQDAARRNTTRLVVLFALAVIAIIVSVDVLIAFVLAYLDLQNPGTPLQLALANMVRPEVLAVAVGGTVVVVLLGSGYKIVDLWGGGRVVAEHLGGRRLNPDTTEPSERQLLNVVEEMAIASGTATPPVYLLDREDGINAFAAGFSLDDAVIGVTRGTAERLSRDELQGVIAHEFSHILNGDMRLNLRLIGVLHGIMVVALIGQFVFRLVAYSGVGRRGSRNDSPVPVVAMGLIGLGVGLMAIGFVGTFFGSMIKAAVSRQREFLADASAVQFTRNPGGIAGALKKIGGLTRHAEVEHPNASEMSHLFFGQATRGLTSLFATHPPLSERIIRLDPAWDRQFVESTLPPRAEAPATSPPAAGPDAGGAPVPLFVGEGTSSLLTEAVESIGRPRPVHLAYAADLVAHMPAPLVAAAHDTYSARALVYALLIDRDPTSRAKQMQLLASQSDPGLVKETERLILPVARLAAHAKLPLLEMTMPALDALTDSQYVTFTRVVAALIEADEKIALFEWALQRILVKHLDAQHGRVTRTRLRYQTLHPVAEQSQMVLSMLAWVGHPELRSAERAFGRGWEKLELPPIPLLPIQQCDFARLDDALAELDRAEPSAKHVLLLGAAICVESDAALTANEVELMRAIAAVLSCPMPPLVGRGPGH